MCGTELLPFLDTRILVNRRTAQRMMADGVWSDLMYAVSPDLPGHAPAEGDRRFPRMGGKPSQGTKKDKRLKKNKRK